MSCTCADWSVADVLDELLRGTSLGYQGMGDDIVIGPSARWHSGLRPVEVGVRNESSRLRMRQTESVSRAEVPQEPLAGVVVDTRGQPVAEALVRVQGTELQARTDQQGRFQIDGVVGTEVVLEVSLIGYRPLRQRVRVGNTELRLVVVQAAINLDEIVVTGTAGGEARRALGNSVARINVDELVDVAPVRSVGDLLNGRAPGAVIMPGSGRVGSGPRIVIRGQSSLSLSSGPLVYIDGVRVSGVGVTGPDEGAQSLSRLSDLNPDDIESIEVIKGPAAATLYGTEASNGVIQILTRRGRASDRPTLSLSVREGGNWFMNPEGRVPHNFSRDPSTGEVFELDLFAREAAAGRSIFRTGHVQGYNLSLRGGSDLIKYYSSIGFDREEGAEPNNAHRRLSGRLNVTATPLASLNVTASLGVVEAHTDLSAEQGPRGLMWNLVFAQPTRRDSPTRGFNNTPPEALWPSLENVQNVRRYTAGVQISHEPTTWFSHRLNIGIDQSLEDNQRTTPILPDSIRQFLGAATRDGERLVFWRNLNSSTLDYNATGTARLSEKIEASTAVGLQYYRSFTQTNRSQGLGFPAPGVRSVAAAAQTFGLDDYVENTTVGVYVQQQFTLNNRLFITGAVRADDNSAFGQDFSLVKYPKVSGAWVVSEEPFWNIGFVNDLKLRAAYGQSGRQPESFAGLQTYSAASGLNGSTVTPQALGNPDLGPERGEEVELGFEAGLLNRRVGIDFTYYNKRTRDAILTRDVAPSSGFPEFQFVNAGLISNTGLELQVNVTPVELQRVRWNLMFSVSTNDNEIVELDADNPELTFIAAGARTRHQVGHPVGSFFQPRVVSATYNPTTRMVEDVLCDGGEGAAPVPCAQAPFVFVGRATPKYEGAVSTDVTLFDRLRVYAQVDFKGGHSIFDVNNWARCAVFVLCEAAVSPELYDPVYVANTQTGILGPSFIPRASFAKLREISVSYSFPASLVRRMGANDARVTVAGRNLHTWTSYPGIDPEAMSLERAELFSPQEQAITPQLASLVAMFSVTW